MDSITFLKAFHPGGPWVLTAIQVDKKGIETATFKQPASASKWIAARNGKRNIYFSVNLPSRKLTKKATREDITHVPWLHVDLDARAGEPLGSELERILDLLQHKCPVPKPTTVVYSGGGYQAFWRLKQPIEVDNNAEELALYNKQLEIILGGDNCHNIDRIMRLPGTTNIPNAKKVAKGRVVAKASVAWFEPELKYDITEFTPAPVTQMDTVQPSTAPAIDTANIERLSNVDELDKWNVTDRIKVILVQGHDPDEPKAGDNSRSAWLFDAICQLVRKDVPTKVIFSIITDPDFDISSSVLDKAPNSDRYAQRQIQRAVEEVEEPWLRKLNEKFAVIGNLGGKCRIVEELYDSTLKRSRLTKQTFQDFQNRFNNSAVQIGKKSMPVGKWWTMHPKRRQFDYITFSPGRNDPTAYNLWQGFGCRSLPGENHELYLQHILQNVCSNNKEYYKYIIGWMARTVQKPDTRGETAIVLRGPSGTGKGVFAKTFGSIWGRHFLQVSDAKHLVGSFNAHLRDCIVLFGDEAFFAGDRRHESALKTLVTEEIRMIEHKGVDAEVSPNYAHLILASNAKWVVPTGATERRYFVLDVGDKHKQDSPYFERIEKAMRNGGNENLLHFLLNYDLSGFKVRTVPYTTALMEQKLHSLDPMEQWWLNRLIEGTLIATAEEWTETVPCDDIINDYISACAQFNVQRRGSAVALGMFLRGHCPGNHPTRVRSSSGGDRKYYYHFPDLRACRKKWDDMYSSQTSWGTCEAKAIVEEQLPF